jgi:hypothetical protein
MTSPQEARTTASDEKQAINRIGERQQSTAESHGVLYFKLLRKRGTVKHETAALNPLRTARTR